MNKIEKLEKYYNTIYNEIFSKENHELCINYLKTLYDPILLSINSTDKDKILDEIITLEKQNYKEFANIFETKITNYQSPTPETIIKLYCDLAFRLAVLRINEKKDYILLAQYCSKVFNEMLDEEKFSIVCETENHLISEAIVDFSFASGNNNMSFRIHDIYGNIKFFL